MIEQRKFILEDGHTKTHAEVQENLKAAGFNLERGYQTLRGAKATVFIQDIDSHQPRIPDEQMEKWRQQTRGTIWEGSENIPPLPPENHEEMLKMIQKFPVLQRMDAIKTLIAKKLADKQHLTPIEVLLSELIAGGISGISDRMKGDGNS